MGGTPKKNTPADMRLASNKKKYGTPAQRDAAKSNTQASTAPSTPSMATPELQPLVQEPVPTTPLTKGK